MTEEHQALGNLEQTNQENRKSPHRWILYSFIIVIVLFFLILSYFNTHSTGNYDEFAKCLNSKGVKMFGAYWCPHCADQKKLFGSSFQYVNYIECAIEGDNTRQTPICEQNKIQGYPTWEINGTKISGVKELSELSELSGCQI